MIVPNSKRKNKIYKREQSFRMVKNLTYLENGLDVPDTKKLMLVDRFHCFVFRTILIYLSLLYFFDEIQDEKEVKTIKKRRQNSSKEILYQIA